MESLARIVLAKARLVDRLNIARQATAGLPDRFQSTTLGPPCLSTIAEAMRMTEPRR